MMKRVVMAGVAVAVMATAVGVSGVACSSRGSSGAVPQHVLRRACVRMVADLQGDVVMFAAAAKQGGGRSHWDAARELYGISDYLVTTGSLCVYREGDEITQELVNRALAFEALVISETTPKKGGVERVQAAAAELVTFLEGHMPPRD